MLRYAGTHTNQTHIIHAIAISHETHSSDDKIIICHHIVRGMENNNNTAFGEKYVAKNITTTPPLRQHNSMAPQSNLWRIQHFLGRMKCVPGGTEYLSWYKAHEVPSKSRKPNPTPPTDQMQNNRSIGRPHTHGICRDCPRTFSSLHYYFQHASLINR